MLIKYNPISTLDLDYFRYDPFASEGKVTKFLKFCERIFY